MTSGEERRLVNKETVMPRTFIAGMLCCALMLGGCAAHNARSLHPDETAAVETLNALILAGADLAADERIALGIALDDFGQHLVRRFGASKLTQCNAQMSQSSDIYESLSTTYETNPIFLWQEFGRQPSPRQQAVGTEWLTSVSDHFVFQYHAGSSAERDIGMIKREAESALLGACVELDFSLEQLEGKLDSLVAVRNSASGNYFLEQGEWAFTGGKIPVVLTEDLQEYRALGGREYSSGFCRLVLTETETFKRPLYCMRSIFRYFDMFQLITLNHEIFHAVHFLAPAAEPGVLSDYVSKKAEGGGEFATEDFEFVHSVNNQRFLLEGLATWYSVRYGLVPRALGIPALREMAADLLQADKDMDLKKVIDWNLSLNVFEKVATVLGTEKYVKGEAALLYIGSGCFVEYILTEFGPEKLHALVVSIDGTSSERIRAIFGMDLQEMDQRWKQWIMNRSS